MTPGVRTRAADAADAADLAEFAAATFPLACPPSTPPQDIAAHIAGELNAERFADHLAAPDTEIHVAEAEGRLIGYVMLVAGAAGAPPLPGAAPLELRRIYVDPAWHGQGVADRLLDLVLQRGRDRRNDCVWLGTNQANSRAISFYHRRGFAEVGTRTFTVGCSIECDYVLARTVPEQG